jgi:hypothetical protein
MDSADMQSLQITPILHGYRGCLLSVASLQTRSRPGAARFAFPRSQRHRQASLAGLSVGGRASAAEVVRAGRWSMELVALGSGVGGSHAPGTAARGPLQLAGWRCRTAACLPPPSLPGYLTSIRVYHSSRELAFEIFLVWG